MAEGQEGPKGMHEPVVMCFEWMVIIDSYLWISADGVYVRGVCVCV